MQSSLRKRYLKDRNKSLNRDNFKYFPKIKNCLKSIIIHSKFSMIIMFLFVLLFYYYNSIFGFSLEDSKNVSLWGVSSSHPFPVFNHSLSSLSTTRPLIIAHRGSSGTHPEHTKESYKFAIETGADVIECDVALSKDLFLICLHETWMNKTTNIYDLFPVERMSNYYIPSFKKNITDFFSIDFTFNEIKSLRKKQQWPFRDQNYNGEFQISTLEEMIELAKASPRPIGVHVEIKDPEFFNNYIKNLNFTLNIEQLVVNTLQKYYPPSSSSSSLFHPCFIQSFNEKSLRYTKTLTNLPLVLLFEDYYQDFSDPKLEEFSNFLYGIGLHKSHVIREEQMEEKGKVKVKFIKTDLIERIHKYQIKVHIYTFRNEYQFLLNSYHGDHNNEFGAFFNLNIDGYFTDFPSSLFNFFNAIYLIKN